MSRYRSFLDALAPLEYGLYCCIAVTLGLGLGTAVAYAVGLQR